MALLWSRVLNRNVRNVYAIAGRQYCKIPTGPELATGLEKKQMEWEEAGNDDPFKMKALKRHASTKSNPNIVPSYYDCRIVGCICEEDSATINWMWVFKGEPKRCQCGHWFKLVEYKP